MFRAVQCGILPAERVLFLKSIDLAGFKSFARSTRIELPPGITAFVGPNGSGKSNVVDAIRWCLGEQSMRDLRGQRAEDVIYSGPRRVMGFAEVILTLESDDRDRRNGSAGLSIGRRVHRSGDSEYILNGERVRLRDVSSALREIDIDASRHIVVNQGMADALLVASPAERRVLLEHAAGLSGYRTHREETRQKLATAAQNMVTIETVLAELEPRLRLLRRQARAVRDREEAATRLRSRLVQWYAVKWDLAEESLARVEAEAASAGAEREEAAEAVRQMEEATETWLAADRAFQQRIETARAALRSAERETDAARFQLQHVTDRMERAGRALAESAERSERLERVRKETIERLVASERTLAAASSQKSELFEAEAAARQALEGLRARSTELGAQYAGLGARREKLERRQGRLREERRVAGAALRGNQAGTRASGERLAATVAGLEELEESIEGLTSQVKSLESALTAAEQVLERSQAEVEAATLRMTRLEHIRSRLRADASRLIRQREGVTRSLAALEEFASGGILPRLQVPEGWELAAAAGLGAWVGESMIGDRSGWAGADYGAFAAWRTRLVDAAGSGARWADVLVTGLPCAPTPLHTTLLVGDEDQAEEVWRRIDPLQAHTVGTPPVQVVARSGAVWSALGVERERRDDRAARYLVARRETAMLDRRVRRAESRLAGIDQAIRQQQGIVEAASERRRQGLAKRDSARRRRDDTERGLREAERRRWRLAAERDAILQSGEESRAQERQLAETIGRLEVEVAAVTEELGRVAAEHDRAGGELKVLQQEQGRATAELESRRKALGDAQADETRGEQMYASLRRELDRLRFEERQLADESRGLEEEKERLAGDVEAAREALEGMQSLLDEHATRVSGIEAERPQGSGPTPDLAHARRRLTEALAIHERARARLEQRREEMGGLAAEIERELSVSPQNLAVEREGDAPTDDEIRRLRSRANQYADADESVLSELAEIEERYTGLRTHLEDLQTASDELNEIMATADREMNRRFAEAFEAVNSEFGRVFTVMLRGGEARLEQVDAEGGIGIRAQLPGKRAQSSAAFSGGEKALVASSLLFGVLNIRPTPFCVLDEVDAALDETNVDRYLAALRDISTRTQVIVVTHNRATMAAADVLYGVTMDDEGMTGLLSLRLDAYEAAG